MTTCKIQPGTDLPLEGVIVIHRKVGDCRFRYGHPPLGSMQMLSGAGGFRHVQRVRPTGAPQDRECRTTVQHFLLSGASLYSTTFSGMGALYAD